MNPKYLKSISIRKTLGWNDIDITRKIELYDYSTYGHVGGKKFHSLYDEERYQEVLNTVTALQIPEDVWPYYTLEEDFYQYNSLGYRTHDFNTLPERFDLVIGSREVEGLGIRAKESWWYFYEQQTNRCLVNLGKAGISNTMMRWNLQAWMKTQVAPENIFIFWTEPSIESYVRKDGSIVNLCYGNQRSGDNNIDSIYQYHIKDAGNWSNQFLDCFLSTNMMLSNCRVHNIFSDLYWDAEVVADLSKNTGILTHYISMNNTTGGWAMFQNYNYFPAADMTHHGWQHQKPLLESILGVMA